jgi:uncharacterized protein
MRNVRPRKQLVTAGVFLVLLSLAVVGQGFSQRSTRNDAMAARAVEAQGKPLTKEQQDAKKEWDAVYNRVLPSKQKLQEEIDNYRKGYGGVMTQRAPIMRKFNFVPVYFPGGVDIWALMLIGMALFKLGVLQGVRSAGFYVRLAAAGYGFGIAVNSLSTYGMITSNYDIVATTFWNVPYEIGRVAVALGHASVIILIVKGARMRWLTDRLAAVGQMAFSNYISHSIFSLAWSPIWLRYFRFGPLEWCWRSLTYWQRQPMRRRQPVPADAYAIG